MTRPTKRASKGAIARARAASKPAGVVGIPVAAPLLNPVDSILADAAARSRSSGYVSFWTRIKETNHAAWPILDELRSRFAKGELTCSNTSLYDAVVAKFSDLEWPKQGSFRRFIRGELQ